MTAVWNWINEEDVWIYLGVVLGAPLIYIGLPSAAWWLLDREDYRRVRKGLKDANVGAGTYKKHTYD